MREYERQSMREYERKHVREYESIKESMREIMRA